MENGYPALVAAKQRLRKRLGNGATYGELSEELTEKVGRIVSKGAIYKFKEKDDYDPTSEHLRQAFDLPHMKPAPACPTCGEVHTKKTCPRTRNGKPRHYVVSLGYIPEGERDPYRQLAPDQRRQAMDNFIKEMED